MQPLAEATFDLAFELTDSAHHPVVGTAVVAGACARRLPSAVVADVGDVDCIETRQRHSSSSQVGE